MNPSVMLNCASPLKVWGAEFQNYGNHDYGVRTLAFATAVSSNTGYVQVAEAIGNKAIFKMCESLAWTARSRTSKTFPPSRSAPPASRRSRWQRHTWPSPTAATIETPSPSPRFVREGKTLYEHKDEPTQVLTAGEAEAVTNVLRGVMNGGTGSSGMPSINQPVAGKTGTAGTASDTTDLWFCGYTPQLVCSIWTGKSGGNYPINGFSTASLPLPIFRAFMTEALAGTEREDFPTGDAPQYKANSSWKFSGGTEDELKKQEEEKKQEEGGAEAPGGRVPAERPEQWRHGSDPDSDPLPPTPAPTPDPQPTPDPEPSPEPEPQPQPQPQPQPHPPGRKGTGPRRRDAYSSHDARLRTRLPPISWTREMGGFLLSDDLRLRYDEGMRRMAAELFAEGRGYHSAATRLGLPPTTVRKWHRAYVALGLEGLLAMGKRSRSYRWELKASAARDVVEGGEPKAAVMARYGIASLSPLEKWCKAYRRAAPRP